jgi:hypothetical protein
MRLYGCSRRHDVGHGERYGYRCRNHALLVQVSLLTRAISRYSGLTWRGQLLLRCRIARYSLVTSVRVRSLAYQSTSCGSCFGKQLDRKFSHGTTDANMLKGHLPVFAIVHIPGGGDHSRFHQDYRVQDLHLLLRFQRLLRSCHILCLPRDRSTQLGIDRSTVYWTQGPLASGSAR